MGETECDALRHSIEVRAKILIDFSGNRIVPVEWEW